jgi:uroporphyrinogen III methyltransferase/synthase
VVELPAIRIEPLIDSDEVSRAMLAITGYDLLCLSSPNAVELLFEALPGSGLDVRALSKAKIAAIGPGTAEALRAHGIEADVRPERSIAEGLVAALAGHELASRRVLIARAEDARNVLPEALAERGAEVDVISLYRTVRDTPDSRSIEAARDAGWITFTSASTVENLLAVMPEGLPPAARIVSIGPITSEAVREAGLEVSAEAESHDLDGLLEALLADVRNSS